MFLYKVILNEPKYLQFFSYYMLIYRVNLNDTRKLYGLCFATTINPRSSSAHFDIVVLLAGCGMGDVVVEKEHPV